MLRRLCLKNHVELVVAITEDVRLEHLRQFHLVLIETSLSILEVLVGNDPVELRLLEVVEQGLKLRVDHYHQSFEPHLESIEVLTVELLDSRS